MFDLASEDEQAVFLYATGWSHIFFQICILWFCDFNF